jgi:hypothetical protein
VDKHERCDRMALRLGYRLVVGSLSLGGKR